MAHKAVLEPGSPTSAKTGARPRRMPPLPPAANAVHNQRGISRCITREAQGWQRHHCRSACAQKQPQLTTIHEYRATPAIHRKACAHVQCRHGCDPCAVAVFATTCAATNTDAYVPCCSPAVTGCVRACGVLFADHYTEKYLHVYQSVSVLLVIAHAPLSMPGHAQ